MIDNDSKTEEMIQAAGKTAPRVTPTSIKAVIASEHYFTAADAVLHMPCTDGDVAASNQAIASLGLLTFCVLVLQNGFTVTGKSACASPENFDANIGRKVAFDDALNQIWPLEGYLLKQRLFDASCEHALLHGEVDTVPSYQRRVMTERDELVDRAHKLAAFTVTPTFNRLDDAEQVRMGAQLVAMNTLAAILSERIAAF